jgi:hypothetical protein
LQLNENKIRKEEKKTGKSHITERSFIAQEDLFSLDSTDIGSFMSKWQKSTIHLSSKWWK